MYNIVSHIMKRIQTEDEFNVGTGAHLLNFHISNRQIKTIFFLFRSTKRQFPVTTIDRKILEWKKGKY